MTNNNSPYQLPVVETISTSWDKVSGSKGSIWAAIGILVLIMFGLGFVEGMLNQISPALAQLVGLVFTVIELLLQMGLIYIGINRAFDKPISYRLMFNTFSTSIALKIIGLYVLNFLILLIPVVLIGYSMILASAAESMTMPIILGFIGWISVIYLTTKLYLATAFILDQNAGPVTAIKQSFATTTGNMINLIGLIFLQMLILFIAAIPFGIGLIWAIPLALITYGTAYKRLTTQ